MEVLDHFPVVFQINELCFSCSPNLVAKFCRFVQIKSEQMLCAHCIACSTDSAVASGVVLLGPEAIAAQTHSGDDGGSRLSVCS